MRGMNGSAVSNNSEQQHKEEVTMKSFMKRLALVIVSLILVFAFCIEANAEKNDVEMHVYFKGEEIAPKGKMRVSPGDEITVEATHKNGIYSIAYFYKIGTKKRTDIVDLFSDKITITVPYEEYSTTMYIYIDAASSDGKGAYGKSNTGWTQYRISYEVGDQYIGLDVWLEKNDEKIEAVGEEEENRVIKLNEKLCLCGNSTWNYFVKKGMSGVKKLLYYWDEQKEEVVSVTFQKDEKFAMTDVTIPKEFENGSEHTLHFCGIGIYDGDKRSDKSTLHSNSGWQEQKFTIE